MTQEKSNMNTIEEKIKKDNLKAFFEQVNRIKDITEIGLIKRVPDNILACPFCDDAFESLESLARHMVINHYYQSLSLLFELVKPENIEITMDELRRDTQ